MNRITIPLLLALTAGIFSSPSAHSQQRKYGPGDPFAAIDGEAIYLGEMNLILSERMNVRDLEAVDIQVKQATAALLVRRHLALNSLFEQGGDSLQAIIDRDVEAFAREAKRRGSSLEKQAKARLADENSLTADIAWRSAWARYLKSTLTEKNLRRFFEARRIRYAGGRWKVSQIFVEVDPADRVAIAQANKSMSELADKLKSSESIATAFADAAVQHSDAASAGDGGAVGWVEKDGDMPASVMEAVRNTTVGSISKPVRSPLGMHLVLVHELQVGKLKYDDITDQGQLRRDATNVLFDELVKRQADAKIVWFIGGLKPPSSIPIIPR